MYILGAATVEPETTFDDDFLSELGIKKPAGVETTSRPSVLKREYVRVSKNKDVRAAQLNQLSSPTDLGYFAALKALNAANISAESLGLVLGDTATPEQTIPSEAQRIAGRLGLKVPAYDILGLGGALSLFFSRLYSVREETLPDYILLVTTNTPTVYTDYSDAKSAYLFGDSAVAILVSPRIESSYKATISWNSTVYSGKEALTFGRYFHLRLDAPRYATERSVATEGALECLADAKKTSSIANDARPSVC